ncbi:choice-of-anchor K domain-containing protein [Phenylobacterium sp.]|uniref:choice-of-anchor K domain-containing protein n=1 Tax=Phenylobacterium sp. TaxID=1871053 RepID=UPI0025E75F25|nr:choice-of-anchor K domain-containing protein [Phenylobacterium sp.]
MFKLAHAAAIGAALLAPMALATPAAAIGFYSGTVTGAFKKPVTTGYLINTDGSPLVDNVGGDAVYSGVDTSALTWGSGVAGGFVPGNSSLTFAGDTFTDKRSFDPEAGAIGQIFKIGSLTYFNGTSDIGSSLYGATLHLDVANATYRNNDGIVPIGVTGFDLDMSFLSTVNTGISPARDSDFLRFDGFDVTFNVIENGTAVIDFYGLIVGDPQFSPDHFEFGSGDGFLGHGVGSGAGGVPEPAAWAMMLLGFGLAGAAMRRRRSLARLPA